MVPCTMAPLDAPAPPPADESDLDAPTAARPGG